MQLLASYNPYVLYLASEVSHMHDMGIKAGSGGGTKRGSQKPTRRLSLCIKYMGLHFKYQIENAYYN